MSDVAQLPSDDDSVSAHSVLVRSESASGGGKSRCGTGYALRLLDRVMGADRVFVRLYYGEKIREPADEREKRIILWGKMADSLKLNKHLLEGVMELDVKAFWF